MRENELYGKIIKGAWTDGLRLWRVHDSPIIKSAFDICGITSEGIAVAIEVKVVRTKDGIGPHWNLYEPHQRAWLVEYGARGGVAVALEFHLGSGTVMAYCIGGYNTNDGTIKIIKQYALEEYNHPIHKKCYIGWQQAIDAANEYSLRSLERQANGV